MLHMKRFITGLLILSVLLGITFGLATLATIFPLTGYIVLGALAVSILSYTLGAIIYNGIDS